MGQAVAKVTGHCAASQNVAGSILMRPLGFFIDLILPVAYGPGVDPTSNRNEYQGYLTGDKAANA